MPQDNIEIALETLKSAAKLCLEQKQEQEKLNREYDERLLDMIFEVQKEYDDLVRNLASDKQFLDAIPSLLEEYTLGQFGQSVIWHVAYLSQDLKLVEYLFTMAYEKDSDCFDRRNALSLIKEEEADTIINYLKTKDDSIRSWLHVVDDYVAYNRSMKHVDLFFKDGTLRFPGFFDVQVAHVPAPEVIHYFRQQDIKKKRYEMFLLKQPESWQEALRPESIKENYGDMVSRYGSPKDLPALTACIEACEDIYYKIECLPAIGRLGSLKALTWLYEQLKHPNLKYRLAVFMEMCLFFYDEVEDGRQAFLGVSDLYWDVRETLYECDEEDTSTGKKKLDAMFTSENLRKAWKKVEPAIFKYRDINTRYWLSKPVDLLKDLKEARYDPNRESPEGCIDNLMAWTGENFPFDRHAYLEKQEEQLDVWEKYLKKNRKKFAPGHWYRWGERLDSGTEEITQLFE